MKLLISGSRTLNNAELVFTELSKIDFSLLISGGAKGADSIAESYCLSANIKIEQHKPDYKKYGKGAPIVRNKEMADLCDFAIIFWDGKSKGTLSTINFLKEKNKNFSIIHF